MKTPSYQQYSDVQLADALNSIDKNLYPENYQKLLAEIIHRKAEIEADNSVQASHSDPSAQTYLEAYWDPATAEQESKSVMVYIGGILLLIVLVSMNLPAIVSTYLTEQHYHENFVKSAWVISALTFVTSFVLCNKKNKVKITQKQRKLFKLTTSEDETYFIAMRATIIAIVFSLVAYLMSLKSAPVVAHLYLLDKQKAFKTVTVVDKYFKYRNRHCNGKVYLKGYEFTYYGYICGVPRKTWEAIETGEQLILTGTQSEIGFLVNRVRRK